MKKVIINATGDSEQEPCQDQQRSKERMTPVIPQIITDEISVGETGGVREVSSARPALHGIVGPICQQEFVCLFTIACAIYTRKQAIVLWRGLSSDD